jgi:hypothetical protein
MAEILEKRERTIDEMRVQTMYKMVEDVRLYWGGAEHNVKRLYLTNKQCSLFSHSNVHRLLAALDLGKVK